MKSSAIYIFPILSFLAILLLSSAVQAQKPLYNINSGKVKFTSDAPLELIEASSDELKGIIDPEGKRFAFSIPMSSFNGFNSPLQREHFNENYIESHKYPNATFSGKIIENIDFTKDGKYTVRAKGDLTIHGVKQERIIKSDLEIKNGKLYIASDFTVLLKEHNISIPKIVNQKIAEEIYVQVKAELEKELQ